MTGAGTDSMAGLDLAGLWTLASEDGRARCDITLPGDVHSALQAAGIIPDPYVGRNETLVGWVAESDWTVRRRFTLEDPAGDWYLDLDGLDTLATVRINGRTVLEADNCFRRYRPEVGAALVAGENEIEIRFASVIAESARRQAAQPFPVPYIAQNSPIPNGNMLRKPQCDFGWDWNIALAPLGAYGRLMLRKLDLARIEHVTTRQDFAPDGSATLTVHVTLFAAEPAVVPLTLTFGEERVRLDCGVAAGETVISHVFAVENPSLWWPAGSGEQALYSLTVGLPDEKVTRLIGFRTVELVTTPDAAGSRFALKVNGREIFARGANWIPADALFSRTSEEKTAALLQSAADAHMNMIRVWGGGRYESRHFYETCDRLGLMVWQDFMFACNLYPSTPDFLDNVTAEVEFQVRRLINHPSIVLWCGDNELVGALTWFPESRANRDRYLVSYDRLNRTVEQALARAAPEAIWWPSSPASGHLDYGDAWHADGSGDMHYWSVWHENRSFDNYRSVRPRFCSEFGFQSYTSMPVLRGFAGDEDLNIAAPVIEHHQRNAGGNERIAATMFRYFRFPDGFANFVYLSQIQQGLAIRTAVDYWRSLKPHCMGTLYWQLNDTWPVASWASLDHGGRWKALHYMAARFYQPVTVSVVPEEDGFRFTMVNDTAEPVEIDMNIEALTLDGARLPITTASGRCGPDEATLLTRLPRAELPEGTLLAWHFIASNGMSGEGHLADGPYKALDLKPSGLRLEPRRREDGLWDIVVSARGLALYVMIETEAEGRFSDNCFDLAAGESRTVLFTPADRAGPRPEFRACDLKAAETRPIGGTA